MDLMARARLEMVCHDIGLLRAARKKPSIDLLRQYACMLVTGCEPDVGLTAPLVTFARAIQSELRSRRAANVQLARLGHGVHFNLANMYTAVRAKMVSEGEALRRQAIEWEEELTVRHPGWEPPAGKGPVENWEAAWVKSGYLSIRPSGKLQSALPKNAADVPGTMYTVSQVGWVTAPLRVVTGLDGVVSVKIPLSVGVYATPLDPRVCTQLTPGANGGITLNLLVVDVMEGQRLATLQQWSANGAEPSSEDWVVYTDGGHEGGGKNATIAESAGWGWVAVSGGNTITDESASLLTQACGPVELNELAPAFIGARKLSNNVAEGGSSPRGSLTVASKNQPPAYASNRVPDRQPTGCRLGQGHCSHSEECRACCCSAQPMVARLCPLAP